MNEFKCSCVKCNLQQSYENLKEAYMDGWNFGRNAVCWDCQQTKADNDPVTILDLEQ